MYEQNEEVLQRLLSYYRNKCNKLEYDFLLCQANFEQEIKKLQSGNNSKSNTEISKNKK